MRRLDSSDSPVSPAKSREMAGVRTADTKIEQIVRSYLFRAGFRFRKNDRRLPGSPDIVLPRYRTVVFVHGCFWHGHEGCRAARLPTTRTEFWAAKQAANHARDARNVLELSAAGWRVVTIWSCEIENRTARDARLDHLVTDIKTRSTVPG